MRSGKLTIFFVIFAVLSSNYGIIYSQDNENPASTHQGEQNSDNESTGGGGSEKEDTGGNKGGRVGQGGDDASTVKSVCKTVLKDPIDLVLIGDRCAGNLLEKIKALLTSLTKAALNQYMPLNSTKDAPASHNLALSSVGTKWGPCATDAQKEEPCVKTVAFADSGTIPEKFFKEADCATLKATDILGSFFAIKSFAFQGDKRYAIIITQSAYEKGPDTYPADPKCEDTPASPPAPDAKTAYTCDSNAYAPADAKTILDTAKITPFFFVPANLQQSYTDLSKTLGDKGFVRTFTADTKPEDIVKAFAGAVFPTECPQEGGGGSSESKGSSHKLRTAMIIIGSIIGVAVVAGIVIFVLRGRGGNSG